MKSWRLLGATVPAGLALIVLTALANNPLVVVAQKVKEPGRQGAEGVKPVVGQVTYPHINLAKGFEVDAKWPQQPPGMTWGDVPGITVDDKDNVYVFTRANPCVQVYDAGGKFLRSWGDRKEILISHGIRIDPQGNVWTTDVGSHTVKKYTPKGELLLTLGTPGKSGRDKDHFFMPTDTAFTPAGDIYVSDGYGNARIVQFDKNGKYIREWGELGPKPGMFSIPHNIVIDSKGRLYVADRNNVRIQVFDPEGKFLSEWRDLVVPWGLWMTKDDELWVCGCSPMRWNPKDKMLGNPPKDQVLMRFNTDGKLLQLATLPKGADGLERPGEVNWVHCIAVDSRGNMYLGDIRGKRAQKFVPLPVDKTAVK